MSVVCVFLFRVYLIELVNLRFVLKLYINNHDNFIRFSVSNVFLVKTIINFVSLLSQHFLRNKFLVISRKQMKRASEAARAAAAPASEVVAGGGRSLGSTIQQVVDATRQVWSSYLYSHAHHICAPLKCCSQY